MGGFYQTAKRYTEVTYDIYWDQLFVKYVNIFTDGTATDVHLPERQIMREKPNCTAKSLVHFE